MVGIGANTCKKEAGAEKAQKPQPQPQPTPSGSVGGLQLLFTLLEVLLSFTAFILQELIVTCTYCLALYYFEFVSCTAFLLTVLFLIVGFMHLPRKLDVPWLSCLELFLKIAVCSNFLIASIIFFYYNDGTQLQMIAVVFGFLTTFVFMTDIGIHMKM